MLDQTELIQDFKDAKDHIKTYFTSEKLNQLLNYITNLYKIQDKKQYKYPFQAAEVFAVANNIILDFFETETKSNTDQ